MVKRFFLFCLLVFSSIGFVNGAGLFSCEFKYGNTCDVNNGEQAILYAVGDSTYTDSNGKVLSSPVSTQYSSDYNNSLCCKIDIPNVNANLEIREIDADQNCSFNTEEILYFTDDVNGRVGYPDSPNFDISHFEKKICVELDDKFSSMSLLVSEDNYEYLGYECLFRTNDLYSSVVSDCDSRFGNFNTEKYKYTVWARLWENLASLKCEPTTCVSKLDGRVYSACSQKFDSCAGVPVACDGALYESWVDDNNGNEVQCSSPWNQKRSNLFTDENLKIESDDSCSSLINNKYSVLVDNELVTMNIYICSD